MGTVILFFIYLRKRWNGYSSKYNETKWVMGMRKVALMGLSIMRSKGIPVMMDFIPQCLSGPVGIIGM